MCLLNCVADFNAIVILKSDTNLITLTSLKANLKSNKQREGLSLTILLEK